MGQGLQHGWGGRALLGQLLNCEGGLTRGHPPPVRGVVAAACAKGHQQVRWPFLSLPWLRMSADPQLSLHPGLLAHDTAITTPTKGFTVWRTTLTFQKSSKPLFQNGSRIFQRSKGTPRNLLALDGQDDTGFLVAGEQRDWVDEKEKWEIRSGNKINFGNSSKDMKLWQDELGLQGGGALLSHWP